MLFRLFGHTKNASTKKALDILSETAIITVTNEITVCREALMTRFLLIAAVAAGVLLLGACAAKYAAPDKNSTGSSSAGGAAQSVTPISPEEVNTMLQSKEDFTLVDVRTSQEYVSGHIPGAILLPNEKIADTQPSLLPDLDAKIVVYCRSGRRSAEAAKKLAAMGYTHIYDLGGILSWSYETAAGSSPDGEEAAQ
jgi:phage shock protein E